MLCLGEAGVMGGRGPVAIDQKPVKGSLAACLWVGLYPEGKDHYCGDVERF